MATITAVGFGKSGVDGIYTDNGTKDGYTRYVKNDDTNMIVEYRAQYGPYSFSGSYYVIRVTNIGGAAPIEGPLYKNSTTTATGGTWITQQDISAGTTSNTAGTIS